jgi:DNA polymerase elongation subunit (family B)
LKSEYKDPEKIAHKVLADRMKERDPGSAPQVNDRLPFVYIQVDPKKGEKVLQGNRIEHPDYIKANKIKPDYEFYLTNQIMKPVLQVYALVVEDLQGFNKGRDYFTKMYPKILEDKEGDEKKARDRLNDLREDEVKKLLFDPILNKLKNKKEGNREITEFFKFA